MNDRYEFFLSKLNAEERKVAPEHLFYEGNFDLLINHPRVSVIGSRKADANAVARTRLVTRGLVSNGIVVVSGLASGVDTIAHTEAIDNGGATIAVLGTPLDKCNPVSNRNLLDEIKRNHLAVSQFPEGQRVFPSNFPARNKTMALMSDAVVIIEATEKSGTRHQAWEAIRLGRQVYILENLVKKELDWVTKSIEYGAEVLTRDNYMEIFALVRERAMDLSFEF